MAACFKTPAPPGRNGPRAEPRPILTLAWRLGADGRLVRRWQAAAQ